MTESDYILKYLLNCVNGKAKFKRFKVLKYSDLTRDGVKTLERNPKELTLKDFKFDEDFDEFGYILFHLLDDFVILKDETNHG